MNNRLAREMLLRSQLGNVAQLKTERAKHETHVDREFDPDLIEPKDRVWIICAKHTLDPYSKEWGFLFCKVIEQARSVLDRAVRQLWR